MTDERMTPRDHALPSLLAPEGVLHREADQLASRFSGIFSRETVDRCLTDSYAALAETARVTTHLPVLATRFAKDRLTALARAEGAIERDGCEVLFVCVHNAGRSQMAAWLLAHHGAGRGHVRAACSQPAADINAAVIEAMAEVGIDITTEFPKPLTDDVVQAADVVVTMGCGDACPVYPGKRYLDWQVPDPAGLPLDEVRAIRADIETRVRALLAELHPTEAPA